MKKITKIISVLLVIVLGMSSAIMVNAAQIDTPSVEPQWDSISSIDLDIAFVDTTGTVGVYASRQSTASSIKCDLTLYEIVNGDEVYMDDWSASSTSRVVLIAEDFTATPGATYYAVAVITAYTDGVPETFTTDITKTCPSAS